MPIVRVRKTQHFTTVANQPFQDSRLSWEARGVVGYLLTKPDNWEINAADLVNQGPAGRDKIYSILRELVDARYLMRRRLSRSDGRAEGWYYELHENQLPEITEVGQLPALPDAAEPDTANPTQINTDKELKTEEYKTPHTPQGGQGDFLGERNIARLNPCPTEQLVEVYNATVTNLVKARVDAWAASNKRNLRDRWKWLMKRPVDKNDPNSLTYGQLDIEDGVAWFERFFRYADDPHKNPFLCGKKTDFVASLIWLVKAANFAKVIEGHYDERRKQA